VTNSVRIILGEYVIFSVPHFSEALLRKMYWYVFLEKRSAGMKFRNKKKYRRGIAAYTGPFRALCVRMIEPLSFAVHWHFNKIISSGRPIPQSARRWLLTPEIRV
jgi:hypothetical protein